ncbi:uncharacterized protein LOC108667116 [Hyalella azteca]|uniref:Uncharacterized protein LOC108667116 n=1 Tax=Hyalella azteca TaxID=294128 RepID=A0A8B7N8H3_HYAAZ|nr:uncharacterized protein LOC108667116 [Hyalella azteca]
MSQVGMSDSGPAPEQETSASYVRKRAAYKGKITLALKKLVVASVDYETKTILVAQIKDYLREIDTLDGKINDISEPSVDTLQEQLNYLIDVSKNLSKHEETAPHDGHRVVTKVEQVRLPALQCATFSGEGSSSLDYSSFIQQFNNVIDCRHSLSDASKLTYLKTYLKGYALKIIDHLSINNENYAVALQMLEREFIDRKALVNDLIQKLFDLSPKYHPDYLGTKIYINEIRSTVSDLKKWDCDLLQGSGNVMLSVLLFGKLPNPVKQEFARKFDNFPSCEVIFDNYPEPLTVVTPNSC